MKCPNCGNGHLIGVDQQRRIGFPTDYKSVLLRCKSCANEWSERVSLRASLPEDTKTETIEWTDSKYAKHGLQLA
jgi:hypothetical protein